MDADIIMEYHKGDEIFALVHNGKIMMLVSFFDEPEQEWLPDEEEFNEEPPLWFCSNRHRRSPVYTLKLAAEYLKEHAKYIWKPDKYTPYIRFRRIFPKAD